MDSGKGGKMPTIHHRGTSLCITNKAPMTTEPSSILISPLTTKLSKVSRYFKICSSFLFLPLALYETPKYPNLNTPFKIMF